MKKILLFIFISTIFSNLFAQSMWNEVWNLQQVPFQADNSSSEYAKVIAGFDTDEDGMGEFITGYTDLDSNYVFMYEATGDNTYEMVWYFKFPLAGNSWFGAAVGDVDNNGKVDIVIGFPTAVTAENPNPPRVFIFEWNAVQGENKYGKEQPDGTFEPTNSTRFDVPDNTDWRPYSMLVEDVDKDGVNELVIGVRAGGRGREVMVASVVGGELSGFGHWQVEYNFQNSEGGSNFATITGDLDNDGNTDIFEMVWNQFTLRMFEVTGADTYEHVNDLEQLYPSDFGSVDGVRIVDANGDGKNELFIAGTESELALFLIQNVTDISKITADDVIEFYHLPRNSKPNGQPIETGLRGMVAGDPDGDGNINLLIAGERNGQIFDLEYKGEGDLADSTNWELNIIYDSYQQAVLELGVDSASALTPRLYYGALADDMDGDGLSEYVFVNYSTDKGIWQNDIYVGILESDKATGVELVNDLVPNKVELSQNYPNPFNPSTNIGFSIAKTSNVELNIYDVLGNKIATLVNEQKNAGFYNVDFDGSNLSSGVYYYTLRNNGNLISKKMLLLK